MMPGEDGLAILRGLDRETGPAVILHSVIGEDVDRIVGLWKWARTIISAAGQPARAAGADPLGAPQQPSELRPASGSPERSFLRSRGLAARSGRARQP